MDKVSTWLWCNRNAEEMAELYTSLIPDSEIVGILRSPADNPGTRAGEVLVVEFTLAGRSFAALNTGSDGTFTEAISLQVACDDQAEVDRLWEALTADGGEEIECGWLKDKWGVRWQITPRRLTQLIADPATGRAAMEAMMKMKKIDIAALEAAVRQTA